MASIIRTVCAFLCAVTVVFGGAGAHAQERILRFVSDVDLQSDGSAEVAETIRVLVQGQDIRRGILRDVTNVLDGSAGARVVNEYEVHSVTRNGQPEPFTVENSSRQFHIRIGDSASLLQPGEHEYVIRYRLTRIARAFDDHDEIYWNATGNDWQFRIDQAVARIKLPEGARIEDAISFTGTVGSTGSNAIAQRQSDRVQEFTTTVPLDPGEGLTVAVAFNKGVVVFPEGGASVMQALMDRIGLIVGTILSLISILFNIVAWVRVGRDPRQGVIFPRFYPPEGISPATLSYVANRARLRIEGFTAALFSLGAKGLVTLANDETRTILTVLRTSEPVPEDISPEEQVTINAITDTEPLVLDGRENQRVATLYSHFRQAVIKDNEYKWIRPNIGYIAGSLVLLTVLSIWMSVQDGSVPPWTIAMLFAVVFFYMVTAILRIFLGRRYRQYAPFGAAVLIACLAYYFGIFVLIPAPGLMVLPVMTAMFVTAAFVPLMSAVTSQGRTVLDEIEGFRMYIETAEKERLNMEDEPPLTMERFEAILPYAIALKLEEPWTEHFERYLARAIAAGMAVNTASASGPFDRQGTRSAVRSVSRSVTAASSSSSGSSSSGSSGSSGFSGGFSGGGSGGGGGRGW